MKRRIFMIAGALAALLVIPQVTLATQACQNPADCAQVIVGNATGGAGATVTIPVTFQQGPNDNNPGGIDEIAAIALSLGIPGTENGTPLTLGDCTLNSDGLPAAVTPDPSISNFKVVVENASCANGRTHCLCPDPGSGISPDDFINVVIYGPNPLPAPGSGPVDIPTLPTGPQQLLTISLTIGAGASGTIPLHVFNQTDVQHPTFTALLSVGDKLAVDQTCGPATPPCAAANAVSLVAITDGSIAVSPGATPTPATPPCAGDCNGDHSVDVTEIIKLVNIALGTTSISACTAGDINGDMMIDVTEIIKAVNNALNGC
jgi:hypothetical protein